MNDIDFDELDRAVNSLATTNKTAGSPADTQKATSVPTPAPQLSKPAAPQPPEDTGTAIKVTTPHRSARLATRPTSARGNFIDIVPPKPAKRPSRTGQTIQPATDIKPEPTPEPIQPAAKEPEPAPQPAPVAATPTKKPKREEWPDPLDFHSTETKPEAKATETPAEPPQPAPSPFITGAKVEKRPLGGPVPVSPPESNPPVVVESPQPEQPKPETLAVETDKPETPAEQIQPDPTPEPQPEPTTPDLHDTAMISIPSQYKVAAKPASDATRPVFDTKDYHPPLLEETAHAAHPGMNIWGKLFMAVLVIALLAVGGYLAFIYFIQNF